MIGAGLLLLAGVLAILGGSTLALRAWHAAERDARADQVINETLNAEVITLRTRSDELERLLRVSRVFLAEVKAAAAVQAPSTEPVEHQPEREQ